MVYRCYIHVNVMIYVVFDQIFALQYFHTIGKSSFQLVHKLIDLDLFAVNEDSYLQHIIILLFHLYKEKKMLWLTNNKSENVCHNTVFCV